MKLIIEQNVIFLNGEEKRSEGSTSRIGSKSIRKSIVDTVIIPHIGEKIDDSLWSTDYDNQVVEDVRYNFEEGFCFVKLKDHRWSGDFDEEFEALVEEHNWKIV